MYQFLTWWNRKKPVSRKLQGDVNSNFHKPFPPLIAVQKGPQIRVLFSKGEQTLCSDFSVFDLAIFLVYETDLARG